MNFIFNNNWLDCWFLCYFLQMSVKSGKTPSLTRKPSLREQPSYLAEVSVALTRREELLRLRERMSAARLLMEGSDPGAKPWLLSKKISSSNISTLPRTRKSSRNSRGEWLKQQRDQDYYELKETIDLWI